MSRRAAVSKPKVAVSSSGGAIEQPQNRFQMVLRVLIGIKRLASPINH
jgi:hypothetical protein